MQHLLTPHRCHRDGNTWTACMATPHHSKDHAYRGACDSLHDNTHGLWFSNVWNMLPHGLANELRKEKMLFLNDDRTNPSTNDLILTLTDLLLPKVDRQMSGGYF